MHENVVQRSKRYFFVLAGLMTVSIVFLTLKWGSDSKIYKITSHETHVHIRQIPAIDKLSKLTVGNTENHAERADDHVKKADDQVEKSKNNLTKPTTSIHYPELNMPKAKPNPKDLNNSIKFYIRKSALPNNATEIALKQAVLSKETDHNETKEKLTTVGILLRNITSKEPEKTKQTIQIKHFLKTEQEKLANKIGKTQDRSRQKLTGNSRRISRTTPKSITSYGNQMTQTNNNGLISRNLTRIKYNEEVKGKTKGIANENATLEIGSQNPGDKHNKKTKPNNKIIHIPDEIVFTTTNLKSSRAINLKTDVQNLNKSRVNEKYEKVNPATKEKALVEHSTVTEPSIMNIDGEYNKNSNVKAFTTYNIKPFEQNKQQNISQSSKMNENYRQSTQRKDKNHPITESKITAVHDNLNIIDTEKTIEDSKFNAAKNYASRRKMMKQNLQTMKKQMFDKNFTHTPQKRLGQNSGQNNTYQNGEKIIDVAQSDTNIPVFNPYLQKRLRYLGLHNRFASLNQPYSVGSHDTQREGRTVRPDVCNSCFPLNFKRTLNVETLCADGEVNILLLVSTSPGNKEARDAIRQTWGGECRKANSKIKYLFVLGNSSSKTKNEELKTESLQNHDIVQIDFKDSYANLTYKTMTGLKWMQDFCSKAKFVMKTDDDMYVNIELLQALIKQIPHDNFLGGTCWGPSPPHRDRESKWYVPFDSYRGGSFPAMCSGTGYIMSSNIIPKILTTSQNIPFFHLEDVYLALCVKKLGLYPTLVSGFSNMPVPYNQCDFKNNVITSHQVPPDQLKYYWDDSRLCSEQRLPDAQFYLNELSWSGFWF